MSAGLWNDSLAEVRNASDNKLLQGVSRSFYLTLRLLPTPMRGAASLAYLLARTSDTLADSTAAPAAARRDCLARLEQALGGAGPPLRWPLAILNAISDPRERRLLECSGCLFSQLDGLPPEEAAVVREVVTIIIGGQRLDLERFAGASGAQPVVLADAAALEDYTWRVAGCVGEFWTKLGLLTLGERFASAPANLLLEKGLAYGKGLQLVNILRDLPADLAVGRCYLPVADPRDITMLLESHAQWLERAWDLVAAGFDYAEMLRARRLRAASVLPAMLARETLQRLRGATWEALQQHIKVPRKRVYLALARAVVGRWPAG